MRTAAERREEVLDQVVVLLDRYGSLEEARRVAKEHRYEDECNQALQAVEFWDAVLIELEDRE